MKDAEQQDTDLTDFGFQKVATEEKAQKVGAVFDSVAGHYDQMNDLMSLGLHRLWKRFTIGQAMLKSGMKVLDIATGSADLARLAAKSMKGQGEIWLSDINPSMLSVGRTRTLNDGLLLPAIVADAQALPFPDNYFDRVMVAFGVRNMTDKAQAFREMHRVLKSGGRLLVLEFSKPWQALQKIYEQYTLHWIPWLGKQVAGDSDSYRYLAESIAMHPDQDTLKHMIENSGFDKVDYFNLSAGVVALHIGVKL